jgi:hypothetical protein
MLRERWRPVHRKNAFAGPARAADAQRHFGLSRKTTIQTTVSATALGIVIGKAATSAVGGIGAGAALEEKYGAYA